MYIGPWQELKLAQKLSRQQQLETLSTPATSTASPSSPSTNKQRQAKLSLPSLKKSLKGSTNGSSYSRHLQSSTCCEESCSANSHITSSLDDLSLTPIDSPRCDDVKILNCSSRSRTTNSSLWNSCGEYQTSRPFEGLLGSLSISRDELDQSMVTKLLRQVKTQNSYTTRMNIPVNKECLEIKFPSLNKGNAYQSNKGKKKGNRRLPVADRRKNIIRVNQMKNVYLSHHYRQQKQQQLVKKSTSIDFYHSISTDDQLGEINDVSLEAKYFSERPEVTRQSSSPKEEAIENDLEKWIEELDIDHLV